MDLLNIRKILLEYNFSDERINCKLNGDKLVSDKVGCWLLERELIKKYSCDFRNIQLLFFNFDEYANYIDWKEDVILDFYFNVLDVDVIKKYQKNINNDDFLINVLFELFRVPFLNQLVRRFVSNFIHPFYVQNLDVISMLFLSNSLSLFNENLLLNSEVFINSKQVVSLTGKYFDELDVSGNLKNMLFDGINNNNILLWDSNHNNNNLNKLKDKYGISDELIGVSFINLINEDDFFINIPLKGTLEDIFSLVHEFFHYYSMENSAFSYCNYIFNEFPSIFFETNLINFLERQGFDKKEVMTAYNFRCNNHLRLYTANLDLISSMKKIINNEELVLDDFIKDYTNLIQLIQCTKETNLLSFFEKKHAERITEAKNICDNLIFNLMCDFKNVSLSYNYLFAKFLTDCLLFNSNVDVTVILRLIKGFSSLEMDPYDILSIILPASYLVLFKPIYVGHGVRRIPILKK